ncbi:MAG: hypothetical protein ACJAVE_001165, partial [Polaribacter sp.]
NREKWGICISTFPEKECFFPSVFLIFDIIYNKKAAFFELIIKRDAILIINKNET